MRRESLSTYNITITYPEGGTIIFTRPTLDSCFDLVKEKYKGFKYKVDEILTQEVYNSEWAEGDEDE